MAHVPNFGLNFPKRLARLPLLSAPPRAAHSSAPVAGVGQASPTITLLPDPSLHSGLCSYVNCWGSLPDLSPYLHSLSFMTQITS